MIQIAIIIINLVVFVILIKSPKPTKPAQQAEQADEYNYQVQRYNDVIQMIMDNWGDGTAPGWSKVIQDIKKEADHTKEAFAAARIKIKCNAPEETIRAYLSECAESINKLTDLYLKLKEINKTEDNTANKTPAYFSDCHNITALKKQYRKLLKKYHPDNGGSAIQFMEIQEEYKKKMANYKP